MVGVRADVVVKMAMSGLRAVRAGAYELNAASNEVCGGS